MDVRNLHEFDSLGSQDHGASTAASLRLLSQAKRRARNQSEGHRGATACFRSEAVVHSAGINGSDNKDRPNGRHSGDCKCGCGLVKVAQVSSGAPRSHAADHRSHSKSSQAPIRTG
eukprot:5234142-Karenia_brevis.AAC.1